MRSGPAINTTEEQWDKIFEINVKAAFMLCKEVLPVMQTQKSGERERERERCVCVCVREREREREREVSESEWV
jgi:NAD(P)-dependent dehydrogenase (short-subunit alcohol dehydrogenase family)